MTTLLGAGRWKLLALLVLNGLAQAAGAIAAALAVERGFSALQSVEPAGLSTIASVGLMLAAATGFNAWLRARERVDAERLGQSYVHGLRLDLFDHLTSMSPRAVGARSQGSTALRFIGDLGALRKWVSLGVARLSVAVTMTTATIVALTLINPLLAVVTGSAAALGAIGALAQGPSLRTANREARRRRSQMAGRVTEVIGAVGVVQANGAIIRERKRIRRRSRRMRDAMVTRARHLGRLSALAEATASAATASLLLFGLGVGLSAPAIAAGMTVVGLLVPQLRGLVRVQEYRQGALVAREAIDRFTSRPRLLSEPTDPTPLPDGPGRLTLRNVGLGDHLVGVDASAAPGRTIAVVGPNGAGKSTLFSLVARLVDADQGHVCLDGADLAGVSLDEVRAAVGVAGPDLPLLRGSLKRNLTYRHPDATEAELADVVELCDLRELIDDLPDGLDTKVTEGGSNLSAGQRQRVTLARAALGQPRLLLLDEADANLDSRTARVLDRVLAARKGTTLVITHKRERVAAADEVWHLADGRLVEAGPADALLDGDGPTASLFGYAGRVAMTSVSRAVREPSGVSTTRSTTSARSISSPASAPTVSIGS